MESEIEKKLRSYLQLNWLRPENALLSVFKSKCFADIEFNSPSIDISCADGIFTFIHLGGKFHEDFDYYKSTRAKEFNHSSFIDIYDSYDESYDPKIVEKPSSTIDYGTDWKQALLNKSSKLKLYKNLVLHDNNVTPLPFNDNFFKTIYSNSVYWVQNVENLLSDINRILHPDGLAILEVMTPSHLETLKNLASYLSPRAISILDRKRTETMPGLHTAKEWKEIMLNAGFEIKEIRSVYPHKMIIDFWNIGLRPIAHLLIRMAYDIEEKERMEIKKEWVEIFFELFKPLISLKQTYSIDDDPYPCFILKK